MIEKEMPEEKIILTHQLIEQGRSENGGWNRNQFELLGVSWPPLKGWKERLNGTQMSRVKFEEFLELRGKTIQKLKEQKKAEKKAKKTNPLQYDLDLF